MKNVQQYISFAFSSLVMMMVMSSCEDVITVDVEDREAQLVVEGLYTNLPGPQEVILTLSAPYFSQSAAPPVSDATVIISELNGPSDTLIERIPGSGVYQTEVIGEPGKTYILDIFTPEGEHFRSQAETMAPVPPIDSITFEIDTGPFNGDGDDDEPDYNILLSSTDPGGIRNFYQWKTYINGELQAEPEELAFQNDDFFDGNTVRKAQINSGSYSIGDTVLVEQLSLTEDAFEYLDLLFDQTAFRGSIFDTPPAPIIGNVSNANNPNDRALGYFGVSAISTGSTILE